MQRLYSPTQVGAGSFLGGPFAVVYLLWANFSTLKEESRARATLVYGVLFNIVVLAVLPFLPEKFPNLLIPIIYMVIARMIAEKMQMSKTAIAASPDYDFESGWKVVGLSVLFLGLFFAVALVWLLGLDYFGIATL